MVGDQLNVKANKIAAGVESERTNELLQSLAKAINMKVITTGHFNMMHILSSI